MSKVVTELAAKHQALSQEVARNDEKTQAQFLDLARKEAVGWV